MMDEDYPLDDTGFYDGLELGRKAQQPIEELPPLLTLEEFMRKYKLTG